MRQKVISQQRKRFLLALPLVAAPFICLVFYTLGGGGKVATGIAQRMGLNPELPKPKFDLKEAIRNKLGFYQKAEQDSMKRKILARLDPYQRQEEKQGRDSARRGMAVNDSRADNLLHQLGRLQESLHAQASPARPLTPGSLGEWPANPVRPVRLSKPDTEMRDPQLERLNVLLDKVIRIQHPEERKIERAQQIKPPIDEVMPADSGVNTIAAVAADRQELVSGSTMALRLIDAVRLNGQLIPAGQLIYGVVSVSNDRLQVKIGAINYEKNLYTTDLQVYDMDGLAGIHIPGSINRDVVKESADEGFGSLNILSVDGSLGAQAANAGVQTARSLLSRKVRLIRVTVPAGYRVLLRVPKVIGILNTAFPVLSYRISARPPGFVPGGSFIQHCRTEGMELGLQAIYLKDSVLWFGLEWVNRTAIVYHPEYARWFVRDRRVFKRTAVQELPMEAVNEVELPAVGQDSVCHSWVGFKPFALAKDKELILQVGEKGGGRVLELVIGHKEILKAKREL